MSFSKLCSNCSNANKEHAPCIACVQHSRWEPAPIAYAQKFNELLMPEAPKPSEPRPVEWTIGQTVGKCDMSGISFHYHKGYQVDSILVSGDTTIVFWKDGDKTVVKKSADDTFDIHHAFCCALAKKVYGGHNSTVKKMIERKTTVQKKKEKKNKDVVVEEKNVEKRPYRPVTEEDVRNVITYYRQGYTNTQIKGKINWDSSYVDQIVAAVKSIYRGDLPKVRKKAGKQGFISKQVLQYILNVLGI